jgi:hypothetical protein
LLPRFVRTGDRVEAIVGDYQTAHRLAAEDVRLDDLVQVFVAYSSVPYRFRINDHIRSVLALVETARLVGANAALKSARGELGFERFLQLGLAGRVATSARRGSVAHVGADEDVALKLGHVAKILPMCRRYRSLDSPSPADAGSRSLGMTFVMAEPTYLSPKSRKNAAVHLTECGVIRL